MRSYRTFSPLPPPVARQFGGVFSVALSLRSPSLAVGQHTALGVRTFLPGRDVGRGDHPTHSCGTSSVPRDPRLWNRDVGGALASGRRDRAWLRRATDTFGRHLRPIQRRSLPIVEAPAAAPAGHRRRGCGFGTEKWRRRAPPDRSSDGLDIAREGGTDPSSPSPGRPDPLSALEEA